MVTEINAEAAKGWNTAGGYYVEITKDLIGNNIKQKAIIMLIYSAWLRVNEVVELKLADVDAERKLIHIKGAKGRKDGYTLLLDTAMETLRLYMNAKNSEKWLFPGKKENTHLTIRSVLKIFDIQELLGHKSSKTTEIYTNLISDIIPKWKYIRTRVRIYLS